MSEGPDACTARAATSAKTKRLHTNSGALQAIHRHGFADGGGSSGSKLGHDGVGHVSTAYTVYAVYSGSCTESLALYTPV